MTASHDDKCVTSFKGVSATTAQVAGIIALALNSNPYLTKRDVEYLLVHASDHTGLKETPFFRRNGAGLYFHDIFGFGLLNAWKLVRLAQAHTGVPRQLSKTLLLATNSTHRHHIQLYEFCYSCDISTDPDCLTTVEKVEVMINFKSKTDYLRMELMSPQLTHSVLMHQSLSEDELREMSTFRNAKFLSVHFWKENSFGRWKFKLQSHRNTSETSVSNISLTLYGTKNKSRHFSRIADCSKSFTTKKMIEDTLSSTFQETRNIKGIKEVVLSVHWSVYVTIYAVIGLILLVAIMMIVFLRTCGFVHDIHLYHWDS